METNLETLGQQYKTDKIILHGYHRFYDRYLNYLRNETFNMLEIGIGRFNSVDMWKQYFPKAKIYGIDINKEYKDERLNIFRADQSSSEDLRNVIRKMNVKCDFINDDGSHIPEHQLLTFDIFFTNLLNTGGIYIIEGIETSYWKSGSIYGYDTKYGYQHSNSILEKFKIILDFINSKFLSMNDRKSLLDKIDFLSLETVLSISTITFGQNCIIIKKKEEYEYPYSAGVYQFVKNV